MREGESSRNTPVSEMGEARGRGRKKGKAKQTDDYAVLPVGSKRKRVGRKSRSITPSMDGEDDEPDVVSVSVSSFECCSHLH